MWFKLKPCCCWLGRYPGRNQFLSQFILNKTGEQRTAKQVGSRLQQLRDSCPGQECTLMLNFLFHFEIQSFLVRNLLFPSPYSTGSGQRMVSEVPHLLIVIDIVPEHAPVEPYDSSPQPWSESENVIHVPRYPRRLSCVDPTVTFTAPSPIPAQS
ncbi:hypothetical protein B0H13DRAFT_1623443 [Mycena leptocephala]|nr:hypothetical protein B0H13DRAFT_1623443 [Mycena leptocephala]